MQAVAQSAAAAPPTPPTPAVERATVRGWWVWAVGGSFYFVAVFHRMALGVAGLTAEHHLHVDKGALASFTAVQFLVYLGMQIPAGLAADRIGPRRTLAAGLAFMAVGETLFSLAHGLGLGLLGRALVGVGDALVFLNILRLTHAWFPPEMGALLATLTGMVGALGQLIGTVPLQWSLDHLGWTATFAGSGAITAALIAVSLTAIRDRPPGAPSAAHAAHQHAPVLTTIRDAWRRPGTQHGFWIHLGLFAPFQVIGALWGVPFLVQGEGLSKSTAATYLLLLVVAFAAAGPVVGWLAGHRVRRQNRVVLVLATILLVTWAVILLWPGGHVPHPLLLAGFVLCGATAPAGMVAFDVGRRENPAHAAGSATALVNCGGFLGAVVCLELTGLLLGSGDASGARFQHALLPMLILSALALTQSARLARHRNRVADTDERRVSVAERPEVDAPLVRSSV